MGGCAETIETYGCLEGLPSIVIRKCLLEGWRKTQIDFSNYTTGFSVEIGITVRIERIKALRESNVERGLVDPELPNN